MEWLKENWIGALLLPLLTFAAYNFIVQTEKLSQIENDIKAQKGKISTLSSVLLQSGMISDKETIERLTALRFTGDGVEIHKMSNPLSTYETYPIVKDSTEMDGDGIGDCSDAFPDSDGTSCLALRPTYSYTAEDLEGENGFVRDIAEAYVVDSGTAVAVPLSSSGCLMLPREKQKLYESLNEEDRARLVEILGPICKRALDPAP